jgi:hypothetical protein
MKDSGDGAFETAEESLPCRFLGLFRRWWRLDHCVQMDLAFGRLLNGQFSGGLDWRRWNTSHTISGVKDEGCVDLHVNVIFW